MATCAIARVWCPVAMEAAPCRTGLCRWRHRSRTEDRAQQAPACTSRVHAVPLHACRMGPSRRIVRTQDDGFCWFHRLDGRLLLFGIADALFLVCLDKLRHFVAACEH